MNKKYTSFIFSAFLLFLVACDNPAKKLSNYKPPFFKVVFTEGGLLRAKQLSYKETNNLLSKKTKVTISPQKGEDAYETIYNFLKENNKHYGLFEIPEIPYYHVIVAYITFKDKNNKKQIISVGDSWLAYYVHVDSWGETSNILYSSSKKNITNFIRKIVPHN